MTVLYIQYSTVMCCTYVGGENVRIAEVLNFIMSSAVVQSLLRYLCPEPRAVLHVE